MRAEFYARTALVANDRIFITVYEVDCLCETSGFAFFAPYAMGFVKFNPAALSFGKRVCGTNLRAGRSICVATAAMSCEITAAKTAQSTNPYRRHVIA